MSVFSLSVDHAHSLARRVCVSVGVRDAMTSATSSAANNEKISFYVLRCERDEDKQ